MTEEALEEIAKRIEIDCIGDNLDGTIKDMLDILRPFFGLADFCKCIGCLEELDHYYHHECSNCGLQRRLKTHL